MVKKPLVVQQTKQNQNYKFNPKDLTPKSQNVKLIQKLPDVNQTETLQKFFGATVDTLYNPGNPANMTGYIGEKPASYYNPETDYYISEQNQTREFYQLTPAMVSRDQDNLVQALLYYPDLINQIRFGGGNVSNHDSLFTSRFYTWCPPIDIDKFFNFNTYIWVPNGPTPIEIWGHRVQYSGSIDPNNLVDGFNNIFDLPPNRTPASPSNVRVMVDDVVYTLSNAPGIEVFTLSGTEVTIYPTPISEAIIQIWVNGNIMSALGEKKFSYDNDYTFASGTRIIVKNDINPTLIDNIYIVEGVGRSIQLLEDNNPDSDLEADYMIMERGSEDKNPWSTTNRWFQRAIVANEYSVEELNKMKAKRPIIEFQKNLELYNYGKFRRENVDFVDSTNQNFINIVNGQTSIVIDTVTVDIAYVNNNNGVVRVLVTNDATALYNNRVYAITIDSTGPTDVLMTSLEADGVDGTGAPVEGEILYVKSGFKWKNAEMHFSNSSWIIAQAKLQKNQKPLFQLYDYQSNSLNDVGLYPNSTFKGDPIFTYNIDETYSSPNDSVIGLPLIYNANGEIEFKNTLNQTRYNYRLNDAAKTLTEIHGYYFYKINNPIDFGDVEESFSNSWFLAHNPDGSIKYSKQMVVDVIDGIEGKRSYPISQMPIDQTSDNLKVTSNGVELKVGKDFILVNTQIMFLNISPGTRIEVRTYNPETPTKLLGNYELPINLTCNPTWKEIDTITRGEFFEQFKTIMSSQIGFEGQVFQTNNWKDTSQDRSLGSVIIQPETPALKAMLFASRQTLDIGNVIRYTMNEYIRFQARFSNLINTYRTNGRMGSAATPDQWIDSILDDLAVGKGSDYPFYLSRMADYPNRTGRGFIPPTPSFLGITNLYVPEIITETIGTDSITYMVGHDGSRTIYDPNNFNLSIIFRLEQRIYNSVPDAIRNRGSNGGNIGSNKDAYSIIYRRPTYVYSTQANLYNRINKLFLQITTPAGEYEKYISFNSLTTRDNDGSLNDLAFGYGSSLIVDPSDTSKFLNSETSSYGNTSTGNGFTYNWSSVPVNKLDPIWTINTWYSVNSIVRVVTTDVTSGSSITNWYKALETHVSGNDFDTDKASKWELSKEPDTIVLPGHWRGVYQLYYGTDRPHSHPWEMLGFSIKPDWFDSRYGNAPYTRDNDLLWQDLECGLVAFPEGSMALPEYSRPGLRLILPVSSTGLLLDPYESGIALRYPDQSSMRSNWKFGDMSPVELNFWYSSSYPFVEALTKWLSRPAEFSEVFWDTTSWNEIYSSNNIVSDNNATGTIGTQIITGNGYRLSPSKEIIHGETSDILDDSSNTSTPNTNNTNTFDTTLVDGVEIVYRHGIQQWQVDYLLSRGINPTNGLGIYVRGLDVQLSYKVGGFTDNNELTVVSESGEVIPTEDIDVLLYRSPSIREDVYTGVIIEYVDSLATTSSSFTNSSNGGSNIGWRVYGYDILDPVFKIIDGDTNSGSYSVRVGENRVDQVKSWTGNTYYPLNANIRYMDRYFRCIRSHMASAFFEDIYWMETTQPQIFDGISVQVWNKPVHDNAITRIPYGTILKSPQEVADLLMGLYRYQKKAGWLFDQTVNIQVDSNGVRASTETISQDWMISLKAYLSWAQNGLSTGNFIALSPLASLIRYESSHGMIQSVESLVNGVYSILDKNGLPIDAKNTRVLRDDMTLEIAPYDINQGIFGARISASEVEHVILFPNETSVFDVVYDPILNVKQPRLRLQGIKTSDWKGIISSPGYFLSGSRIRPNFETSVNLITTSFDIEGYADTLKDHARANTGYVSKENLRNLLITDTNEYELFQGVIQQKGTKTALKSILRSNVVSHNRSLDLLEEWAFRIGDYGADQIKPSMEFLLPSSDYRNNPQLITFNTTNPSNLPEQVVQGAISGVDGIQTLTNIYSQGGVGFVDVLTQGNYHQTPTVTFTPVGMDTGFGAEAKVVMDWSESVLNDIVITSKGDGFNINDPVTVVGLGVGATAKVTAVDYTNSQVTDIIITNPGTGYVVGTPVIISGGNNLATAEITEVNGLGAITAITVTSSGLGYDNTSTASITSSGTGAVLEVVVSGGPIADIIDWSTGYVTNVKVITGGIGYSIGDVVTITSPDQITPATAEVQSIIPSSGRISRIRLLTPGTGYAPGSTASITSSGTGATLEVEVTGGTITGSGVILTALGAGYDDNTVLNFPTGTGAVGTVTVNGGKVIDVKVTNSGTGYTIPPTVGFVTGTSPIAHATATSELLSSTLLDQYAILTAPSAVTLNLKSIKVTIGYSFTSDDPAYIPTMSIGILGNQELYMNITPINQTGVFEFASDDIIDPNQSIYVWFSHLGDIGQVSIQTGFEYPEDSYEKLFEQDPNNKIIDFYDMFDGEGNWIYRDPRWVTRFQDHELNWESKYYPQKENGLLPNAGYANINDIQWFCPTWESFTNLYREALFDNPSESVSYSISMNYIDNGSATDIVKKVLVPNTNRGLYRITNIIVNVNENWVGTPPEVTIGFDSDNDFYLNSSQIDFTNINEQDNTIYQFIDYKGVSDQTIYVYYKQNSSLTNSLGNAIITINMEKLGKSVLPGQRAWVYDTGAGDWNIYKLSDSGINVISTYPPSHSNQSTVVALDKVVFNYPGTSNDLLKTTDISVIDTLNTGDLTEVYNPKFINRAQTYIDGSQNGELPLMQIIGPAGTKIDTITVSVIEPFIGESGSNPTLSIGTNTDPEAFVTQQQPSPTESILPEPEKPTVAYGQPLQIDIYDEEMSVIEGSSTIPIRVVRSGNVFAVPSSITVTNPGSGYEVPPNVLVTGPNGVKATANLTGPVKQILVLNPGDGYQSIPTITITGGEGTGATAYATLSGGKIDTITVVEASPGSGSGYGFTSAPEVIISGGSPTVAATAKAVIDFRVSSITIDDIGMCGWNGLNPNVTIDPPTLPGGIQATGVLNFVTPLASIIFNWEYRQVSPVETPWVSGVSSPSDYIEFLAINDPGLVSQPNAYWLRNINLPVPTTVDRTSVFEVRIPTDDLDLDDHPDSIDDNTLLGQNTSTVTLINNSNNGVDVNLTVPGTYTIPVTTTPVGPDEIINLIAYINPDNTTGLASINVDYHHDKGFEATSVPLGNNSGNVNNNSNNSGGNDNVITAQESSGADLYLWSPLRFVDFASLIDENDENYHIPSNGWESDDLVFVDNSHREDTFATVWNSYSYYEFGDLVLFDNKTWSSIKGGNYATASVNYLIPPTIDYPQYLNSVSLLTSGTAFTGTPTVTLTGTQVSNTSGIIPTVIVPILENTSVRRFRIVEAGSRYAIGEIITTTGGNGSGAIGRITKVSLTGEILDIEVVDSGQNYTGTPDVVIATSSGRDAVIEVILHPAKLVSLQVVTQGSPWTDIPTITIGFTGPSSGFDSGTFDPSEWDRNINTTGYNTWQVLRRMGDNDTGRWSIWREESLKVNTSKLVRSAVHNLDTNEVETYLEVFDPYKGIIPGTVDRELSYKSAFDPAYYTNGSADANINSLNPWGVLQVGTLWWDLSTVKFLEYEQDSDEYRWKNWGSICPNSSIDVYEWVRSPVLPTEWSDYITNSNASGNTVGNTTSIVYNTGDPRWVEVPEYDVSSGLTNTVYYFWVKNIDVVPARKDRKLSSMQVADILTNPNNSGLSWFSSISPSKMIVGNISQFVSDSSSLRVEWKETLNNFNHHKHWQILREGDSASVPEGLWNKMRDSLVGFDTFVEDIHASSILTEAFSINDNSITLDDASMFKDAGIVNIGLQAYSYSYKWVNTLYGVINVTGNYPIGTVVTQNYSESSPKQVPANWLSDWESVGNSIRPRQSWFTAFRDGTKKRPSRTARRAFVESFNAIMGVEPVLDIRYDWSDIFDNTSDPLPSSGSYNHEVPDIYTRNQLVSTGLLEEGELVLVLPSNDTYGFWVVYQYSPNTALADDYGFTLHYAQKWRIQENECWSIVDWYSEGWNSDSYPIYRFDTKQQALEFISTLDSSLLDGTLIEVLDNGSGRWEWLVYDGIGLNAVAREKATIKLSDNFWKDNRPLYGYGDYVLSEIPERDYSWELQYILMNIRNIFLTDIERNELFFKMVKFAVSDVKEPDWVFKTSFMYVSGFSEMLLQPPVVQIDQFENVSAFINNNKPFHVKIRDFVRRLSVPLERVCIQVTDFDKPVWQDPVTGEYRVLRPTFNAVDQQIVQTTRLPVPCDDSNLFTRTHDYRPWWNTHANTNFDRDNWDNNWYAPRHFKITMKFDRVSCSPKDVPNMVGDLPSYMTVASIYRRTLENGAPYGSDYNVVFVKYDTEKFALNANEGDIAVQSNTTRYIWNSETSTFDEQILQVSSIWKYESGNWETFEYQTTYKIYDIDRINMTGQKTGDVVIVREDDSNWIWNGSSWVEFDSTNWSEIWDGGAADRLAEGHSTDPEYKTSEHISGCEYRGTILERPLGDGLFGAFGLGGPSGLGAELEYYLGMDTDLSGGSFTVPAPTATSDILVDGNEFIDPTVEKDHPEELVHIMMRNPISINVYQKSGQSSPENIPVNISFRAYKSGTDEWEFARISDDQLSLDTDLLVTDKVVNLKWNGVGTEAQMKALLHNPADPTPEFMASIKQNIVGQISQKSIEEQVMLINILLVPFDPTAEDKNYSELSDSQKEELERLWVGRNIPGIVFVGAERIIYWTISVDYANKKFVLGTEDVPVIRGNGNTSGEVVSKRTALSYDHWLASSNTSSHGYWDNNTGWYRWQDIPGTTKVVPIPANYDGKPQRLHVYAMEYTQVNIGGTWYQVPYKWVRLREDIEYSQDGTEVTFLMDQEDSPTLPPLGFYPYADYLSGSDLASYQTQLSYNIRIEVIESDWSDSEISWVEDTRVVDASAQQFLPIRKQGYRMPDKSVRFTNDNKTDYIREWTRVKDFLQLRIGPNM